MRVFLLLLIAVLIDQLVPAIDFHDEVIYVLFAFLIFRFVQSLTVKISIAEIISLIGCLIYLLMPLIAYKVYNAQNYFARLYDTVMQTEEEKYFSLALPGTLLMIIGLHVSLVKLKVSDLMLVENCKNYLSGKKHLGIMLVIIGIFSSTMIVYAPQSIRAIVYFFSQLTFIGFLYLLHSRIAGKGLIIAIALSLLIGQSALTGMYGELVYWTVLGGILLIIGKKINYVKRVAVLVIGAFMILVIQSVKHEYRLAMWSGANQGSKPGVMFELVKNKFIEPSSVVEPVKLFAMVNRANQGALVARTMEYVPKYEKFANGETIITSIAASIVPRFLWADKPEVGGREMICRFMGECRRLRYSFDIGQLGEGYVNFGIAGGAIFMFFYGLFIRSTYTFIANLSLRYPSLILWVPLFFFAALSLETDVLTFLNSFVKSVIFCAVIFLGFRTILKIKI